ncbi:MAG: cytochrome c family protein [Desulfobulbaceae bacterium]|nr:cytochrome c family protein [Desulfobulbaceae bacterium]
MSLKKGKTIGLAAIIAIAAPLSLPFTVSGEVFELNSLSSLYEGVSFDHDMHIEATEDNCTVCHHHTAGTPPEEPDCVRCHRNSGEADSPKCSDCHVAEPFSAANLDRQYNTPNLYHTAKPGLKAVYHLNCLGCHQETGGPTGCQDCHTMTDKGEKFYNTGHYAPKEKPGGQSSGHH